MYICKECGFVFDEPKELVETHGLSTPPYETWYVCPNCNDTAICEAQECERCGTVCAELSKGLCDVCYEDMYYE